MSDQCLRDISQLHLYKQLECRSNFKKIETSITSHNTYSGKMNINGLSGCINRVSLERIIHVGILECGHWGGDIERNVKMNGHFAIIKR